MVLFTSLFVPSITVSVKSRTISQKSKTANKMIPSHAKMYIQKFKPSGDWVLQQLISVKLGQQLEQLLLLQQLRL